jgi:arylsulfatase A-like enzyme
MNRKYINIFRRRYLLLSLLLAAQVSSLIAQERPLPNVIFIMADDLGIGDIGPYGQKIIKTPAIDKLSTEGIRFAQHYVGAPVCGPSRCSVITGKHTGRINIRGNALTPKSQGEEFDKPLAAKEITIAEIMKRKGYATAVIGKWGLGGPDSEGSPNKQGFDYFFGYLNQASAHKHFPQFLFENNTRVTLNKKVYSHDAMEEKALNFIEKNAGSPFMLYFVPTLPHAELLVPNDDIGEYAGMFTEKPFPGDPTGVGFAPQARPIGTYAAMVARLDKSVERILDLLKQRNIDKNTIVIFTSDNGVHDRAGYNPDVLDSNGPFKGIKRDMYEGGIRTPFIVRWPDKIKPGTVSFHISAFYDLLPTLCHIIGVKAPESTDGVSFLPSLTGKGIQQKHDFLYWELHESGGRQAVLKDNWKLIRFNADNKDAWKYELYNISQDPGEQMNVLAQYPEKVKAYIQLLDKAHHRNDQYLFSHERNISK